MRLFLLLSVCTTLFAIELPSGCRYDETCLLDVPGMICADGTSSYITLTARPGARNTLIHFAGGGACWSQKSCDEGFATTLTRKPPAIDWNNGEGIFDRNDPANPFGSNYHIISVPYCTGDIFAGDREINYSATQVAYVIRHRGYQNAVLAIAQAKAIVGNPERVVLLGQSAGGMGTYFHLKTVAHTFNQSRVYVVNDAGVPFKQPYLPQSSIDKLQANWGVHDVLLQVVRQRDRIPLNFGELIQLNKKNYPNVRFGLVAAYKDPTMSFFALALNAMDPLTTVRKSLVDVFANDITPSATNARVFYLNESVHTRTDEPLDQVTSAGVTLSSWLTRMLSDTDSWDNVGVAAE